MEIESRSISIEESTELYMRSDTTLKVPSCGEFCLHIIVDVATLQLVHDYLLICMTETHPHVLILFRHLHSWEIKYWLLRIKLMVLEDILEAAKVKTSNEGHFL